MLASKALAAAVSQEPVYVEDVFSTYLYTGNGSTQTITNGIDLDGEGGLVWIKSRSDATDHQLFDTERTATYELISNSTAAQAADTDTLTAFNSDGFDLGADATTNTNAATYASWTFRKAEKFFDVVTYAGTGSATTIAHDLGAVPGMIIVKRTDTTADWQVYHRSLTSAAYKLVLNSTAAEASDSTAWNSTAPTSAVFSVGTNATVNASGGTYVAYLFAHDAGGFGLSGSDNVISCGSLTTTTSGDYTVSLGWEPQWVLVKRSSGGVSSWWIFDNMRGIATGGNDAYLDANTSGAETTNANWLDLTSTGFTLKGLSASSTYIYIAIRRGPMKVPESGTEVYNAIAYTGNGSTDRNLTGVGFPVDASWIKGRGSWAWWQIDRLRGGNTQLDSSLTLAEQTNTNVVDRFDLMDGVHLCGANSNNNATTFISHFFRRAPGFFDVVCATASSGAISTSHNLGVSPELVILKPRSEADSWYVYHAATDKRLYLNSTGAGVSDTYFSVSSTTVAMSAGLLGTVPTLVIYLFATVAGVSKVGSYTGTGTTLAIDCGFTAGARFVMIKRTDSTGDWYVWDSVRGIVAGNDPYLLLNSTAAEVTSTDYVDTDATGFEISSTAPAAINDSGGTYIFLAIA